MLAHVLTLVLDGAATIASSPEALVDAIRAYLADRTLNRAARQSLTDQLCPYRDGNAGQRLARVVVDHLRATRKASASA